MPRRQCLAACGAILFLAAPLAFADDQALWREFGLVETKTIPLGARSVTAYRMKDLTGALAAWQWQRASDDRDCPASTFCAENSKRTLITVDNYLLSFAGAPPSEAQVQSLVKTLPDLHDTSLPAILTFVPHSGLVPNSSRYILGPESLRAFAPDLANTHPGFNESAEAQTAEYEIRDPSGANARARLVLFNYPTPDMARTHAQEFRKLPGAFVKRSGVLVAIVLPGPTEAQASTLLSRVEYEAQITLNEEPPPSPIKPLYRLLFNIIAMSIALSVLALFGGIVYGLLRLYRRRYGNLESEEALTALRLTGE